MAQWLIRDLGGVHGGAGFDLWSGNSISRAATKTLLTTTKAWHSQIKYFKK